MLTQDVLLVTLTQKFISCLVNVVRSNQTYFLLSGDEKLITRNTGTDITCGRRMNYHYCDLTPLCPRLCEDSFNTTRSTDILPGLFSFFMSICENCVFL
ncbi:hypothetical protein NPIL_445041 [Nephila pilipes]|uniref:Uncharacterized protein n=1 Tax=Nephila pilipes TaxID=299642 RepID=A0A8X6PCY7_NEPPI|nr:hypothetical protein NPIL_445041 [Nephila pilipes]